MSGTISESQQRIALLVMGVGRSGTSALTRVLNLLGAALPEALIGPGAPRMSAGIGSQQGWWR